MRDVEVRLPPDADCDVAAHAIDDALVRAGLMVTLRDSLKKFPGCIHWHAKNGRQSGTLEITVWPEKRRAWFTIQSGRSAMWIDDAVNRLQEVFRQQFGDK